MELWGREDLDLVEPAFIEFDKDNTGSFGFIAVEGWMDCHATPRDGCSGVEFSWEGTDDCDPASGRGWAVLDEAGSLHGHIYFHLGDNSGFHAVRADDESKPGTEKTATTGSTHSGTATVDIGRLTSQRVSLWTSSAPEGLAPTTDIKTTAGTAFPVQGASPGHSSEPNSSPCHTIRPPPGFRDPTCSGRSSPEPPPPPWTGSTPDVTLSTSHLLLSLLDEPDSACEQLTPKDRRRLRAAAGESLGNFAVWTAGAAGRSTDAQFALAVASVPMPHTAKKNLVSASR